MPKFVELWVYLSATPLFGLTATLVVYVVAQAFYARTHQAPWANPVLWTVVVLAGAMLAAGISYPTYFAGAQFIHFLLGPAVVALAWPLWQRRAELRQRWGRLLVAALIGGLASSGSALALGWAAGLPLDELGRGTQVRHRARGHGHCRKNWRNSRAGGGVCGDHRHGGRAAGQVSV